MGKWKMASFDSVFEDVTRYGTKIKKEDYLSTGLYPIIDQGKETIGGYTNNSNGLYKDVPVIIFGDHTRIVKYVDSPLFLGADGVKLLRLKSIANNTKFMYYCLLSAPIPNTGYNRHFKWLKELLFPIPPLDMQQKIAAVLDKASALIELRKAQIDKLDLLIKSQFVEMFGNASINSKGYKICKLGDLTLKITDGVHAKPNYTMSGRPFLSVVNITSRKIDFTNCKFVSEKDFQTMIRSTHPQKGDVLYTKVGATYGIPAYVDTDKEFCLYVSVCLIKPIHELINSQFLALSMDMPYIKRQADNRIKGIGVPDLHLNQIREFDILCPPIEEQESYIQIVSQINRMKSTIQQSLEKMELNYKSLMQKCFRGEIF